MKKTNIVLVGFSGSGKSTIGKQLAQKLNFNFIDTDRYFEEKYRFSVYDFFGQIGEGMFRKLESELLKEVIAFERTVIATGGGTPCFYNNIELINQNSLSIYIKLSEKSLFYRLFYSKKRRPLTKKLTADELQQYIQNQLAKREPFYKKADLVVKGENLNLKELVQLVATKIT